MHNVVEQVLKTYEIHFSSFKKKIYISQISSQKQTYVSYFTDYLQFNIFLRTNIITIPLNKKKKKIKFFTFFQTIKNN